MILRRFPYREDRAAEPPGSLPFHRRNIVVHAQTDFVTFGQHTAPLSIKTVMRGRESYAVDGRVVNVEESTWLVINNDQPYASFIDSTEPVDSFCLFFEDGMAEQTCSLDDPRRLEPRRYFPTLRRMEGEMMTLIQRVYSACLREDPPALWIDERMQEAAGLLGVREPVPGRVDQQEVARRLHVAKDYLESHYELPVSLADAAGAAMLSKFHFLRAFTRQFGRTPHQYLTDVRLRKARLLLARGEPVLETCLAVGFENHSSFTRLYRRRFGVPPSAILA